MPAPLKHHPRALCLELPTERDAMKVAERIADELADGSMVAPGSVITVTDERGNIVGKVPVPRKQ